MERFAKEQEPLLQNLATITRAPENTGLSHSGLVRRNYTLDERACVPCFRAPGICCYHRLMKVEKEIDSLLGKLLQTGGWRRSDFYLGREFSLAGVATAVTSILVIILKPDRNFQGRPDLITLGENFAVVFVGFVLFMLIVSMSQDYENEDHEGLDRIRELKLIGCISNMIGFGLLVASVALMAD